MTITLQTTREPLGLSIGVAPEFEAAETPGPDVDLLMEALRVVATAQARQEINELRGELSEAQAMIADLERDLERMADRSHYGPPGRPQTADRQPPSNSPLIGGRELAKRVVRRVQRALGPRVPVRSARARQILDEKEPLFLDFETTGLRKTDKVVEAAVMDSRGNVLFSSLINPGRHIPAEATQQHGIRDRDVADAPTWEEVGDHSHYGPLSKGSPLQRLLQGRTVVAHNAPFEAKFTPDEWKIKWVCTKKLADAALGKASYWEIAEDRLRGGSLEARLHQCGLRPGPAHTAAGDCLSTLRLMRWLAGYGGPVEIKY